MTSFYLPSGSKIGVGYQVHELANALVRRGHTVTVFSSCGPTDGAAYETVTVRLNGSLRTVRFAPALRAVDLRPYDVLHSHGDDYLIPRSRRPPCVRTLHGSCFAEALYIHGMKDRLRMLVLGAGETISTLRADRAVVVSPPTRRWAPWIGDVMPNGVDRTRFHPGGTRSEQPTILFVGTYERRKRGRLLLEAFKHTVRPAVPDARLLMVCEDAPREAGAEVLGRVSDVELVHLYQTAWVFCLPSLYEGFGIPYAEALSCGTPVVATPNPGARYVLANGRYGEICPPEHLGRRLVELLRDGERRQRMSDAGQRRAEEFSIDRIAMSYEHMYRCVVAETSNAPAP